MKTWIVDFYQVMQFNEQKIEAGRPDKLINRPKRIRHKRMAPETWVKNNSKKKNKFRP